VWEAGLWIIEEMLVRSIENRKGQRVVSENEIDRGKCE
jgi:hypothetical protein